jgi:hypothetical protein
MAVQRHNTLILLRTDGSNRTWLLTPRRIFWMVAAVVLLILTMGFLLFTAMNSRQRYIELEQRYGLLASREVLALGPQPTPVDQVPGAAEMSGAEGGATGDPTRAATEPQTAIQTPTQSTADAYSGMDPGVAEGPPVRLQNFGLRNTGGRTWELSVEVTKSIWNDEVLRGYTGVVIENAERPGDFITHPQMTLREGKPVTPQSGEGFAIRRFKPLRYQFELPEEFRMAGVLIVVYDRSGMIMLERAYPVDGRP